MSQWINHQRQEYKKGKLSQERIDLLEAQPGWKWEGQFEREKEDPFPGRVEELRAFVEEYGEYPKQAGKRDGESSLGTWINTQRRAYKKGKLSQERVGALEALPGWKWKVGQCERQERPSDSEGGSKKRRRESLRLRAPPTRVAPEVLAAEIQRKFALVQDRMQSVDRAFAALLGMGPSTADGPAS